VKRLVEYSRGLKCAIDAASNQENTDELSELKLACEVAYSLLSECLAQDFCNENDPASTSLLYPFIMKQFTLIHKQGIGRICNEDFYPPLENSGDRDLCEDALPQFIALQKDADEKAETAWKDGDEVSRDRCDDLSDAAAVIINKLTEILESGPDSDYDAADYRPIPNFS
jgi:hypothetical protein